MAKPPLKWSHSPGRRHARHLRSPNGWSIFMARTVSRATQVHAGTSLSSTARWPTASRVTGDKGSHRVKQPSTIWAGFKLFTWVVELELCTRTYLFARKVAVR